MHPQDIPDPVLADVEAANAASDPTGSSAPVAGFVRNPKPRPSFRLGRQTVDFYNVAGVALTTAIAFLSASFLAILAMTSGDVAHLF